MNGNFLDLLPSFVQGVHTLRFELIGVAFVLSVAGLIIHAVHAFISKNLAVMFPVLVRLTVIAILIGSLESFGDILVNGVSGLTDELGVMGGFNIFQDYQAAIARKMGSAAAANNATQASKIAPNGQAQPQPLPDPNQASTGIKLTAYGYANDLTPDKNSSRGSGAFPFDTAPGSLIGGYSAALSPDVAQRYNVSPGQSFSVATAAGTYNLMYADKTGNDPATGLPLTGRVDIYDPSGSLGGNNFEQSVTDINGGPVVMGQDGIGSFMPNPGGSIGDQVMWAITLALSWIASAIMFLMSIAQKLLYLIEIAVSPVFIGMLMIPALTYLARRFFLSLVAITLWPLAWGICNLVSKALIDIAVNPCNNVGFGIGNGAALATGPLAGLAYLLVVAVWVIGSTLLAPVFIGILLATGGGTATAAIFGATLGAAALSSARTGIMAAGGPVGIATTVGGVGSAIGSRMNGARQNFARRPMSAPKED